MARKTIQRSIDIPEEVMDAINEIKGQLESISKFVQLAIFNELIRRSNPQAGPEAYYKPMTLPGLIPPGVPTKRVETAQSEKIPRYYMELWTWFKEGVISKEEYNTLLQRYFPSS